MPDHYGRPETLVSYTGIAEILGGLGLLVPGARQGSAMSIALMLVVYFDVHQHMLRHAERFPDMPKWALQARIPLQLLLIAWALQHARAESPGSPGQDEARRQSRA